MVTTTGLPTTTVSEFDRPSVARLSRKRIAQMSRPEMLSAVEAAALPKNCHSHVQYKDPRTLERLVYLARRSCQHERSCRLAVR